MKTTRLYFISGLGADRRVFKKLAFPPEFELIYLDWIVPHAKEPLKEYAYRLALKIDTSSPFYLVGLSLGGMLATEIAKKLNPVHTFIISSSVTDKELPWYFRIAGRLKLQKLIPVGSLKLSGSSAFRFVGAKTRDERVLIRNLLMDSDPKFIKWAFTSILDWRNTERPLNLTHIHGAKDKILPIRYCRPDIIIEGGGHLIVYANAHEITGFIMKCISD